MTPERVREIAMEALAKRLEKHVDPSSWTTNFIIPTKELLEIIERLEPPMKDCPPTTQWQPMDTAPEGAICVFRSADQSSWEVWSSYVVGLRKGERVASMGRNQDMSHYSGWLPIPGEENPQ